MGRPSNTEVRRRQIVLGLMQVMASRGYDGASVAEIAREAGLTPGLVHYHFENKLAILCSLIDHLAETLLARYRARTKERSSFRACLMAFVDAHVATDRESDPAAVACWVAIGSEALRQREVRALYASVVARALGELERLFSGARREAGLPVRDARRSATALFAAIQGTYQLSAAAPGSIPKGSAATALRSLVDGLLDRPEGSPRSGRARRFGGGHP